MFIRKALISAIAAGAALLGATTASAGTQSCFFVNQWEGWKSPSPGVLLLGVGHRDVYRVEVTGGTDLLNSPGVHLISKVRGSDSICNALDLDLSVADDQGTFRAPLIARNLTKLSPDEVAAIPKKFRP